MEETKEERRARKERERAERKKNETEEERRARKERERAERKAREAAAAIEAAAHEDTTLAGSPAPPPAKKAKEEEEKESKKKKSTTTTSTAVGGGAVTKAGEGESTSATTGATTTTTSHHKHRENETEEERRARKERERAERKAREQQQQLQQQEGAASAGGEQGTRSKDAAPVVAAGKEGGVEAKPKSRKPANETEEERRVRKERERAERKAREAAAKAQQQEEQEEEEKSKGAQGGGKSSKHAKDDEKKAPRVKEAAAAQEAKGEGGEGAAGAERTSSKDQQHPHHHHHTSHSNNNTNSATEGNTSESRATAALREAIAAENEAALSRKTSAGLPSTRPPTQSTEHRTDSAAQGAQGRKTMTSGGGGSSRPASRPGLSLVRPSVSSLSGITNVEELRRQAYRTQFAHDLARATALRRLVDLDDVAVVLVDFAPQSAYERYLQRLSFAEAHRSPATTSALPPTLQGKDAYTSRNEEEEGERARGGAVPCQVAVQCPGEESRVDVAVQAARTRLRSHGVQAPDDLGLYPEGLQDATLALSALLRRRRNGSEDEDDEDEEENKSESDGERGDGNESRSVKARQAGKNAAEKIKQQKKNTTTSTTTAAGTTIATLSRFLDRVMPVMEAVLDEGDALAQARHAHGEGQAQSHAPQESTTRTAFSSLAGSLQCNLLTHYSINKGGEEGGNKSDSDSGALYVRPVRALSYHAASPHLLLALYGPFTLTSSSSSQENKTQTNGDVSLLPGSQYASLVLIWDTRSARNTSHRPHTNTSSSSSSSSTLGVSVLPRHVLASDETLTCVTSSAARPHLIYAGTASGAVVVWDLRESDRLHETCGGGVCFSSSYVAGKEGTRGANIPVPHLPSYSSSWLAVDEPGSNGSGGSSNAITTNTAHRSRHNNNNNTEEDDDDDGEEDDGGTGNTAGEKYYAGLRTIAPMRKLVVLGHNSVTKAALRDLLTNNNSAAAAALLDSSVAMAGGMGSGPAALEEAEQLVSLDASGQLRFWRVQEQESLRNTIAESDYAMRPFSVVRLHLMSRMQLRPEFGAGMDWMGGGAGGGGGGALSVSAARMMRGQDAGEIEEAYNADDDEDDEDEGKTFASRGGHVVRRAGPRRGGHRKGSSHGGYLSDSLEHTSHSSGEDEHGAGGRGRRKQQQRWLNVIGGTEAYDVDCMPTDATHLLVCLPDAVHHVSQFTSLTAPALYRPCTSMEVTTLSSGLPTISANTPHGVGSGGEACYDGLRQTGLAAWLPAPRCLTCNAQDSRVWLVGYEDGTVRLYVAAEPMPMLTVVVSEQPIVQVMSYAVVHTAHHTLTSKAEAEAAGGNRSILDENSMSGPLGLGENRGVNPNANAVSSYTSSTTATAASSTRWLSWALDADGAVFLLDHAHVNRTTPRVREPLQAQREMCGKCLCLATPPAMRGAFTESTHSSAVTRTGNEKNNTTTTAGGSNSSSTSTTMLALGYEKGVVQLHVVDHSPWLSNAAERDEQWL